MKYISFSKPNIPAVTLKNLKEVINSGWITTGKKAQLLESSVAKTIGAKHVVAVSSGTAALHLAYMVAGIGQGDEVIVPSYTFCSTINAILHTGAKPVFCDINENTLCLDPNDVKKRITSKTKAIVVVHFAGMPVDMEQINKLARKHKLKVIEDAAHAFLTKYKGKYIGGGKNLTCFSFYATKNLTTAEGGLVICPNLKIANYVRIMSLHGISKNGWKRYHQTGSWRYDVLSPGFKYNLSDIHATIGLSQIPLVGKAHAKRVRLANLFKNFLSKNTNIILPKEPIYSKSSHAWHLFVIRIKPSSKIKRDELIEKLKSFGIGTSVHFIPNHLQTLYKKLNLSCKLPVTEKVFQQVLSLPFYEKLTSREVKYICQKINELTYAK